MCDKTSASAIDCAIGSFEDIEESESRISAGKILLDAGADPNCYFSDGVTSKDPPLHLAVQLGHDTLCIELLRYGAIIKADTKELFRGPSWHDRD